jgi:pyruvate/2-oxoglutarate dehydrogenase complex dihydrolipoamide acyltransferase (E2) component
MAKRKFGDRRDGRRVRDLDGLHNIFMHIMPKRTESEVYMEYPLDVTDLLAFIDQRNQEQPEYKTTVFHCIVTAVARVVTMRPYLNRFICGRKLYERNDITLSFVAKRKFQDHAEESLMVLTAKDDTCLDAVTKKIVGDVKELRQATSGNDFDKVINAIGSLPSPILHAFISLLQWLSAIGHLPQVLTEGDTNHTTVLLSNLGSIQCGCCYHHLNNYGTNSIMITVGVIHKEPRVMPDGSVQVRDMMNLGFTADERIADGFYFARCLKLADYILTHPQLLDIPLKETIPYEY